MNGPTRIDQPIQTDLAGVALAQRVGGQGADRFRHPAHAQEEVGDQVRIASNSVCQRCNEVFSIGDSIGSANTLPSKERRVRNNSVKALPDFLEEYLREG